MRRARARRAVPALEIARAGPLYDLSAREAIRKNPTDVEVWPDASGGCFALSQSSAGRHRLELPGLATFVFGASGPVTAIARVGAARGDVIEAYRNDALPLILHARGDEALHASGVVTGRGVVAFCGASGSGKSTIAYALGRRGIRQWADDVVALRISDARVDAIPLPFEVRLRETSAAALGLGKGARRLAATPAHVSSPLAAIFVLARSGDGADGAALVSLSPAAALAALLPHAFCWSLLNAARKRLMLQRYLTLVAGIPIRRLLVGGGIEALDRVLDVVERAIGEGATETSVPA